MGCVGELSRTALVIVARDIEIVDVAPVGVIELSVTVLIEA